MSSVVQKRTLIFDYLKFHFGTASSLHRDGQDRCTLGCSCILETQTEKDAEKLEGLLASCVGGIDIKPPVTEANADGSIFRTLLGGTDLDWSPFPGHRPPGRLHNSGFEVR